MNERPRFLRLAATLLLLGTSAPALAEDAWRRIDTGIVVTPDEAPAVRLQVYGDGIIRVTETAYSETAMSAGPTPESLMVTAPPLDHGFGVSETPGHVTLTTARASAVVDLASGSVSFRDAAGNVVLAESGPAAYASVTSEGHNFASSSTAAPTRAFTASASTRTGK